MIVNRKTEKSNKGVKGRCKILVITCKQGHQIDQIQHTGSKCRNRSEIGQRTKKIRHNGTKLQIHDMPRHKQLRGAIRYLQYFYNFACKSSK